MPVCLCKNYLDNSTYPGEHQWIVYTKQAWDKILKSPPECRLLIETIEGETQFFKVPANPELVTTLEEKQYWDIRRRYPINPESLTNSKEEWEKFLRNPEPPLFFLEGSDWDVWRCDQCHRLMISHKSTRYYGFWKPLSIDQIKDLKKQNYPCLCGKICQDTATDDCYLQVYSRDESLAIDNMIIRDPSEFPLSKRVAWGCKDCKRIYVFNRGENNPIDVYDCEVPIEWSK